MLRSLTALLILTCSLAAAQSRVLTVDTLWIHRATPNDEDLDSYFPIVNSTNPAVAHNINMALQIQALGYTLSDEKKTALLNQAPNPFQRTNLSFAFKQMTGRLIYIDILTWRFNNTMSLNGWNQINRCYFDIANGHPVFMREVLFNGQTLATLNEAVGSGLRDNMVKVMQKYNSDFRLQDLAALDKECQCNCEQGMKNAYQDNKVRLDYDEGTRRFRFSMDDCDWSNPRAHDVYETFLRAQETDSWLTPYGRYLIYGGTPVANNTFFKMWKGMIGEKIPVTFFLWVAGVPANEGHGLEIYDRHGVSIPLRIKVSSNSLEIQELDSDGKILASISSQLQNGTLAGQWVKADGSKTLSFTASPAR